MPLRRTGGADRTGCGWRLAHIMGPMPRRNGPGRAVALIGLGVAASQLGHLVVYQLRFGSRAAAVESQGAHAYFPTAIAGVGTAAAAALLGAFLVLGAARIVARAPLTAKRVAGWRVVDILPLLFCLQLAIFIGQETLETVLSGSPPPEVGTLIMWGCVGQLPAALLAAVALSWLSARFESAVAILRANLVLPPLVPVAVPVLPRWAAPPPHRLLAQCSPTSLKRGPPQLS